MNGFEVKIEGLEDVQRKLKLLPERLGRNAMRRALRRGANVIRDQARANARTLDDTETTESIAKNVRVSGMSRRMERSQKVIGMRVGIAGGAKSRRRGGGTYEVGGDKSNPGGDTWYWRLLEFGTSKMRARPFMRPAMEQSATKAFSVTADAMNVQVDKEIGKLG